jgi:HEAT repeat protein
MFALSAFKKGSIVIALGCLGLFCAGQNTTGSDASSDETELARASVVKQRVQSIVQAALKEGEFTTAEGIKTTTRVPPSTERIEEVKQLGKSAIPALAEYVGSGSPRTQELAMRFLAGIGGDQIVEALRGFAKRSTFSSNRVEAVMFLADTPLSRALPIIEDVSKTDPDPTVRKTASDIFMKYTKRD